MKNWGSKGPFGALFAGFCPETGQKPTRFGHFWPKTLYFTRFSRPAFLSVFSIVEVAKLQKPRYFDDFLEETPVSEKKHVFGQMRPKTAQNPGFSGKFVAANPFFPGFLTVRSPKTP